MTNLLIAAGGETKVESLVSCTKDARTGNLSGAVRVELNLTWPLRSRNMCFLLPVIFLNA